MRILHLSDTHLPSAAGVDSDGVDARSALGGLLHDCRHLTNLDAVAVSGDVADDGSEAAYRDALALVGSSAQARGAAFFFCVGNHDEGRPSARSWEPATTTAPAPKAGGGSWTGTAARRSVTWTGFA